MAQANQTWYNPAGVANNSLEVEEGIGAREARIWQMNLERIVRVKFKRSSD